MKPGQFESGSKLFFMLYRNDISSQCKFEGLSWDLLFFIASKIKMREIIIDPLLNVLTFKEINSVSLYVNFMAKGTIATKNPGKKHIT